MRLFSNMNSGSPLSVRPAKQIVVRLGAAAAVAALALVVSACSSPTGGTTSAGSGSSAAQEDAAGSILEANGLEGLDAAAIIETLDTLPLSDRPSDLMASVQQEALIVSNAAGDQEALPMPADQTYVSIAPFVSQTHPCTFHSLTTCVGEMQNEDITVTITDADSGEVIMDEALATYDNGFFGVWLPRDITATVSVSDGERSGSETVSTRTVEDPTCVTTLQLS